MILARLSARVSHLIEHADGLDGVAGALNRAVHKAPLPVAVRDALSGTWIGHPAHPFLVTMPIGCWTAASVLDASGPSARAAAQRMVGAGLISVVPTALTGLSDWADTTGAEQRVGLVHLSLNLAASGCYGASWLARRARRHRAGVMWALAGATVASAAGWLGGHLAYALGVGVDTNAFEGGPLEWTAIEGSVPAPGGLAAASVAGVALVVANDDGRPGVLANRCSHRGGPLSDGELADGCVTCPWHHSRFDVATGSVRRGPAVVAQPAYELRSLSGTVEVRRDEARSLRINSVRPAHRR